MKSLSHSLNIIREGKSALVTKNADCRMKQNCMLICGHFVSLCFHFHIWKKSFMRVVRSNNVD